jgi:UV excision repair protein RAD23
MGVDESILEQVLTMGFDRNDSIKALGAAYNNPDRAIEYLLNGIPNHSNNNNNNNNNQPQSNQSTHNLPMPGL